MMRLATAELAEITLVVALHPHLDEHVTIPNQDEQAQREGVEEERIASGRGGEEEGDDDDPEVADEIGRAHV